MTAIKIKFLVIVPAKLYSFSTFATQGKVYYAKRDNVFMDTFSVQKD
jgi:hypothetical protein